MNTNYIQNSYKMDSFQTRIDSQLMLSVIELKPNHFTTTAFIHHLIEEGYKKKLEDLLHLTQTKTNSFQIQRLRKLF